MARGVGLKHADIQRVIALTGFLFHSFSTFLTENSFSAR
jgi:hypothetical protein